MYRPCIGLVSRLLLHLPDFLGIVDPLLVRSCSYRVVAKDDLEVVLAEADAQCVNHPVYVATLVQRAAPLPSSVFEIHLFQ